MVVRSSDIKSAFNAHPLLVGLPALERSPKLSHLLAVKSILLSLLMSLALTPASDGVPPYEVHVGSYKESYRTEVRFTDSKHPPVTVLRDRDSEFPYAPMFTKSTDNRWFLLIQKVGSGDNVAWLYSVDDVGRVFCLQTSLDSMAWQFSDRVHPSSILSFITLASAIPSGHAGRR